MSYEGELIAHYNGIHTKLLGSPPIRSNGSTHTPQLPFDKNSPKALLLRIEALEARLCHLEAMKTNISPENIVISYPLYTQALNGFLGEIFKLVRKNEQSLDPTADLSPNNILGPSRSAKVKDVRQMMYYLMSTTTTKSLPEIGRFINRDHSTILHGKRVIEAKRKKLPMFDVKIDWYQKEIVRYLASIRKPVNTGEGDKANLTKAKNAT